MVPSGYWTDARIQTICKVSKKDKENEKEKPNITSTKKSATITGNNLFSIANKTKEASFTKAVYETPTDRNSCPNSK
jgi:hypothetical protein